MQQPEQVRAAFERDIGTKVLFIKDGKLLFVDGIKLKAIADRKAYFASLRARQAQPIVILAELAPDAAFAVWKRYVLGDKPDGPNTDAPSRQPRTRCGVLFFPAPINRGQTGCRFSTDAARASHKAARMFADSSAHASSQGFRLPRVPSAPPTSPHRINSADARPRDADAFYPPRAGAAIP